MTKQAKQVVTFRATREQLAAIDTQAAAAGVNRTDLILQTLLRPTGQTPTTHAPCPDHPTAGAVLVAGGWVCGHGACTRSLR